MGGLLAGEVSAVGGVVRDALLGRPPGDELDLVVEGDAIALAQRIGRELGARVVAHPRFGTASIELPHGGHVDLVSARTETYARPGALPTVGPGTLLDDLARRDFTVNAMALRLAGTERGELVDPHGGVGDLEAGVLRALRPGAFAEDPSRIVRAARYAARLDMTPADDTAAAAAAVAPGLDPSSARVAEELRRLLDEPSAAGALERLTDMGVDWVLSGAGPAMERIDAARAHPLGPDLPGWALRLGVAVAPGVVARAALPGWAKGVAAEVAGGPGVARRIAAADSPSAVDRLLRVTPPAAAVAALALGADRVRDWWEGDRSRGAEVSGADLMRAGVAPGPAIGRALEEVRAAVLDGRVGGREQQLELALRVARGAGA